jgi:hypothetical protein
MCATTTTEEPTNTQNKLAEAVQSNSTAETPLLNTAAGAVLLTGSSFKQPPGVHSLKQSMKEDKFNAKKIKVLHQCANNYSKETIVMEKTNEICQ